MFTADVLCACLCVRARAHISCFFFSLCLPGSRLIRLWWVGVPGPGVTASKDACLSVSLRLCVCACAYAQGGRQVAPAGPSEISSLTDSNEE